MEIDLLEILSAIWSQTLRDVRAWKLNDKFGDSKTQVKVCKKLLAGLIDTREFIAHRQSWFKYSKRRIPPNVSKQDSFILEATST